MTRESCTTNGPRSNWPWVDESCPNTNGRRYPKYMGINPTMVVGRREIEMRNRILVLMFSATLLPVLAVGAASATPVNCQNAPWGFLGSQTRTICDGPVRADGSWLRRRVEGWPAHYANPSSSCSGGAYYSNCTYYPGGWVEERDTDDETYVVTPDTVLPDEPGHLG